MISTSYTLSGVNSNDDIRRVRERVSDVPHVGAVAIERLSNGEVKMILKHKEDVVLDQAALRASVGAAGDFELL